MTALGAFELTSGSGDAVFAGELPKGVPISVQISDESGGEGCAIAEVYDLHSGLTGNRLDNLSARLNVLADRPLTAGFVIDGNVPHRVLIRGIGPGLENYGITNALPDPNIVVVRTGESPATIGENLNWSDHGAGPVVSAAAAESGAFPLADGSLDAAALYTSASRKLYGDGFQCRRQSRGSVGRNLRLG
ncbi:MAG: hypothetical protein J6386_07405 [Candidatus Synoicihabitans palmerolidicus]|nr:hypothetical protein [Candidatus Synoicihabitans palmerolidicus]